MSGTMGVVVKQMGSRRLHCHGVLNLQWALYCYNKKEGKSTVRKQSLIPSEELDTGSVVSTLNLYAFTCLLDVPHLFSLLTLL